MYDAEKLYRLLKRDMSTYSIARDVLDYMLFIEKSHSVELNKVLLNLERIDESQIDKFSRLAPDFINIGVDGDGSFIISKAIKRHLNSQLFRDQINRNRDIDNSGLNKGKDKESQSIKKVNYDILANPYNGMLPTKNYAKSREVFVVTKQHVEDLRAKYPSKEVELELKAIFDYFSDNSHARKGPMSIRSFIDRWFSGDLLKNARKSRSHYALGAKQFYEELKKNGI